MPTFRPLLALAAAVLAVTGGCASPGGPPPAPPGVDPGHLHFWEPGVSPGDEAPDFTLHRADGTGVVTLSELRGRPVVLLFGSFT